MEPSESRLDLIAYQTGRADRIRMIPSERWRQWMNATGDRFANRCLPLLVANEAGWTLLNPVGIHSDMERRATLAGNHPRIRR